MKYIAYLLDEVFFCLFVFFSQYVQDTRALGDACIHNVSKKNSMVLPSFYLFKTRMRVVRGMRCDERGSRRP